MHACCADANDSTCSLPDSFAAIRTIVMAEGVFGLYRGITPNLLKVAPSIATSFCCYEVSVPCVNGDAKV